MNKWKKYWIRIVLGLWLILSFFAGYWVIKPDYPHSQILATPNIEFGNDTYCPIINGIRGYNRPKVTVYRVYTSTHLMDNALRWFKDSGWKTTPRHGLMLPNLSPELPFRNYSLNILGLLSFNREQIISMEKQENQAVFIMSRDEFSLCFPWQDKD